MTMRMLGITGSQPPVDGMCQHRVYARIPTAYAGDSATFVAIVMSPVQRERYRPRPPASFLAACGGDDQSSSTTGGQAVGHQAPVDFEARFAGLTLAEEPEGDLERGTWPDFVRTLTPEVRERYELHATNGGLMGYIP